jgi:hypothetical protein
VLYTHPPPPGNGVLNEYMLGLLAYDLLLAVQEERGGGANWHNNLELYIALGWTRTRQRVGADEYHADATYYELSGGQDANFSLNSVWRSTLILSFACCYIMWGEHYPPLLPPLRPLSA